ncbi:MAG: prepilin peptidase [Syntrophales bacterium]|nr:prepilin peptidase [Syntrophales bacterium]
MLTYIVAFIVGAVVGSFLNVVISRVPLGRSIISPPSNCPVCGERIVFYDNIPILSFLLLRGRCRYCKERISWRYFTVELLTAFLALTLLIKFGVNLRFLVFFIFLCVLVVVAFIDLEHGIVPHIIVLPGIPICFMVSIFVLGLKFTDALVGLFAGVAILYLIALYYESITGNEGLGAGDVNLLGMIGAFLGWQGLIVVLPVAAVLGAAAGIIIVLVKGKDLKYALPFAPFLSLGAGVYIFVK